MPKWRVGCCCRVPAGVGGLKDRIQNLPLPLPTARRVPCPDGISTP